jgi:sulfur transfer protein SufE
MFDSCKDKQNNLEKLFSGCLTNEEKYQKIIQLGRELPPLRPELRLAENLVKGCQSTTYLASEWRNGSVFFSASSDALISAGLAALLIAVYSGEPPEAILKFPPLFLENLGVNGSLTPSRANGLYSMHLRMKQEALRLTIEKRPLSSD